MWPDRRSGCVWPADQDRLTRAHYPGRSFGSDGHGTPAGDSRFRPAFVKTAAFFHKALKAGMMMLVALAFDPVLHLLQVIAKIEICREEKSSLSSKAAVTMAVSPKAGPGKSRIIWASRG